MTHSLPYAALVHRLGQLIAATQDYLDVAPRVYPHDPARDHLWDALTEARAVLPQDVVDPSGV